MLVTQQSTGPITTICVSPPNLGINCVPGLIELFSLVAGWLADGISPDHSSLYPAIVGPVVVVYPGNGYKLNDDRGGCDRQWPTRVPFDVIRTKELLFQMFVI